MRRVSTRTYVLVHGAWFGGWAWRDVAPALRAAGHVVTTPTLTGLGERGHLGGPDTSLSTHVADLVAHVTIEGLHDIHLVGWSYGGMVITGAMAEIADRVASLVYLDAFVPDHGRSLVDYSAGPTRAALAERGDAGSAPLPIRDPATFGVDDADILAYCAPRLRPQPVRCMTEPVHLPGGLPDHVRRSYVLCTRPESTSFRAAYEQCRADPRWHTAELATTHVCVLTDPAGTTQALLDAP